MYANYARRQLKLAMGKQGCHVKTDGRWQDNWEHHHRWCLKVGQSERAGEQRARDDWLYRCGAQTKID
jgi:hypothetical protein